MSLDFTKTREYLQAFDFHKLFVEQLGWSQPSTKTPVEMTANSTLFIRRQISQLSGIAVFEVAAQDGGIPDAKTRIAIHKGISGLHHENLLIFVDKERTSSLWFWVRRDGKKNFPRDHFYIKGQPGDLFLGKLSAIVFELGEFDENGNVSVLEAANRLRNALDVERVTKKFYGEFQEQHLAFLALIEGIADDRQRRWYASVLLNRLMFIYFLQRKGFIDDGDLNYLQNKLARSKQNGHDRFYSTFLKFLFFEGFAKPENERPADAIRVLGKVKYLNGGLFLPHVVEQENSHITIPDIAFENLFSLFQRYSWNLNDTPGGLDNEINPDVLGYIFEKYINQKAFGAYYTRTEITEYLCERTIHRLILDAVNTPEIAKRNPIKGMPVRAYRSIAELLMNLDAEMCRELLFAVLPRLSLLDPACGSGAFLVAAMKTLINIYAAVIGRIKFLADANLTEWLSQIEREHKSLSYFIKKTIITDNLYGVDIMEEGAEIARLRLFLALVAAAEHENHLEPLPNIDFNILQGNSLIGLTHINATDFDKRTGQGEFFKRTYTDIVEEKNRLIDLYRHTSTYTDGLASLRDDIRSQKAEALVALNDLLLDEFKALGIRYEQATWDDDKNKEGRPTPRSLKISDIEALQPFHWGYEFDRIVNERGGFDAIITNPPWETFQPDAREFFSEYSGLVTKKKMELHDFEKELKRLLRDKEVRSAWLDYHSRFNHLRSYFRFARQYENQVPVIDGRRHGKDVNLFKLFVEQSFNLLREGGECGLVIPSGIYTDLGSKQLRELLFSKTKLTGLFCFENRKEIFENVHRSFKFVVLTFKKGEATVRFPAAFMRHDVSELSSFPERNAISIDLELVRRLSPNSLSIMEFKSELDIRITEKMLRFPLLYQSETKAWNLELHRELNMTDDARLFHKEPGTGRLPLYEGKMIWQFDHSFSQPRYYLNEKRTRAELESPRIAKLSHLMREGGGEMGEPDPARLTMNYEVFRLAYRDIASSTNERSMICTILPPRVFAGNTLNLQKPITDVIEDGEWKQLRSASLKETLFLAGILNSFTVDWMVRQRITSHLNMFYVYQLPVPRLTARDSAFSPIVSRVAKLICTTTEFDELATEAGLKGSKEGVTDPQQRARIRSELDALVAHLYGLSEGEFAHVLDAFPLVDHAEKEAAINAYKVFAPNSADEQVRILIGRGETAALEFKSSARWDLKQKTASKLMEQIVVKTAAGFLNVESGGTLLLGVNDEGNVVGLENDYKTMGKKPNRDGYENWLNTLLLGEFGKDASPLIRISFHEIEGKDVCQLVFQPSPRPIFVKDGNNEHLYIRAGNSTRQLTSREAVEYCKHRWP